MIDFELKIEGYSLEEVEHFKEIFNALLKSGGLSGVRSGRTIIHFDADGTFMGIELDYWPWKRRRNT